MKIIDVHLHASGRETGRQVLRALDAAGVDQACVLAPFLTPPYSLHDPGALRAANQHLARLVRGHEDRLIGFAVVNPALPGALDELERCVVDLGLRGLKMVPSGWFPYDPAACAVYARAEQARLPLLFHSGVFIDGRSSRFSRPAYFEALRDFPHLRATLAHLGWPWTDEAVAVCLIDRIRGLAPGRSQFRLDLSCGPPPAYRDEAVRRAWQALGCELLLYGSDRFLPCRPEELRSAVAEVEALFDRLGVPGAERQRILAENALDWLGLDQGRDGQREGEGR